MHKLFRSNLIPQQQSLIAALLKSVLKQELDLRNYKRSLDKLNKPNCMLNLAKQQKNYFSKKSFIKLKKLLRIKSLNKKNPTKFKN